MSKKSNNFLVVKSLLFSFILFLISSFYFCLSRFQIIGSFGSLIKNNLKFMVSSPKHVFAFLFLFLVYFVFMYFTIKYWQQLSTYLYKYRYPVAIFILFICILFKLNGSSVGCFLNQISNKADNQLLLGISRTCRSDEFAALTPMTVSQYFYNSNVLPYFGSAFRGTSTDMFIVYGQPVRDLAVIFRPFYLGYLFLGLERGFSFFWCARIIALFMVSFEFCMLLTKKNKALSVAYAFLITFSPIVCWWVAINGLVEMLIFGQLAVIIIYYYLNKNCKFINKLLLAIALAFCAEGYLLTFYPAWALPLAYVFLALLIGVLIYNKKDLAFSFKKDILPILVFVTIVGLATFYIFNKSHDAIHTVLNTSYPGKRVELGSGAKVKQYFSYTTNLFFPWLDPGGSISMPEFAMFFDFFPLGVIFALIVMLKGKKADPILIALFCVMVLIGVYAIFGLPSIICKVTCLYLTTTGRTIVAIGFINILFLIRAIYLLDDKNYELLLAAFGVFACIITAIIAHDFMSPYFSVSKELIALVILLAALAFIILKNYKNFALVCILIALISGVAVNPVRSGISNLYENQTVNAIHEISSADPDGKWIVEDLGYPLINVPTLASAKTINSTNTYPDLQKWQKLDPDGKYYDIYNRYAHIMVNFTNDETTFNLPFGDQVLVNLNVNDLQKLDVKYILTKDDLSNFDNNNVKFTLTKNIDDLNFKIYQVQYN